MVQQNQYINENQNPPPILIFFHNTIYAIYALSNTYKPGLNPSRHQQQTLHSGMVFLLHPEYGKNCSFQSDNQS